MSVYNELGVKGIINAAGTYTALGGSRMSEETITAMGEAARDFVPIRELQARAHDALAKLTRNEAAYICNGAATGIYLAVAAGAEKLIGKRFAYIGKDEIAKLNVVLYKAHRNPYDLVVAHIGMQYRELSFPNIILPPTEEDLKNAIDANTAAVYYTTTSWAAPGALPLENVITIAKEKNVPVIVDAAANLPPVDNLWNYTAMGADAVLFSGGKDLAGPQASGLMVGSKVFIDIVTSIGFPNYGIGRMMKVGREEIAGLYSAVKQYVSKDHNARLKWCEEQVQMLITALAGSKNLQAKRCFPNEAGQPIPRAFVAVSAGGITCEDVQQHLLSHDPPIHAYNEGLNGVFINPMSLKDGEMEIIIECLKTIA